MASRSRRLAALGPSCCWVYIYSYWLAFSSVRVSYQGLVSELGLAQRRVAAPASTTAPCTDIDVDESDGYFSTLKVALGSQARPPATDREVFRRVDFYRFCGLARAAFRRAWAPWPCQGFAT